jgi:hypothetical protein
MHLEEVPKTPHSSITKRNIFLVKMAGIPSWPGAVVL